MPVNPINPRTRRAFLKTAAAGSLGFPAIVSARSPNAKLNIACIGVGGRGIYNTEQMAKVDNIAIICDVNAKNLAAAQRRYPKARPYKDFRKIYDDGIGDIDAVVVTIPEDTHAFATLPALLEKKPVFCEKPLTRDVHEARIITEAAIKAGVSTQMGTNIHASDNFRRVVELVRADAVGPIREVHVWVDRAWGWQSPEDAKKYKDLVSTQERPKGSSPIPEHLDWDLWLGPTPEASQPRSRWLRSPATTPPGPDRNAHSPTPETNAATRPQRGRITSLADGETWR